MKMWNIMLFLYKYTVCPPVLKCEYTVQCCNSKKVAATAWEPETDLKLN